MAGYSGDSQPGNVDPGGYGGTGGAIMEGLQLFGMLYDSYQNRKTSKENTDKTIAAQKAEAELAYQRSIEEWNRQNQYNDPESQMARYSAAGLNPNLIYGQGNSGNASSPPSYQPANLQYRYEAPAYGAAVTSVLPMLMQVGTWMQNMRLSQASLDKTRTETERSRQTIEYLTQKNPAELATLQNKLSLFPYQESMAALGRDTAEQKLYELEQNFRQQFGEDLFDQHTKFDFSKGKPDIGGTKRLEYLQQAAKAKLMDLDYSVKSSWADFDITNPQAIIQLVMSGVMGMAGQQLRLSTHAGKSGGARKTGEQPVSKRRLHPARRVQRGH